MIRVMYVIPGLGGTGGAERSLAAMVPFWIDKMELHIVTLSTRSHLASELSERGIRITQLQGGLLTKIRLLRKLVRSERPDLVHTTLFDADLIGRIATLGISIPMTCSLVNLNYGSEQYASPEIGRLKLRLAREADALTAKRVTQFHALTRHVASVMGARLRLQPARITVIGRGRDANVLGDNTPERRARVRAALGLRDQPAVLVAARHEYQKGVDVVVRAFANVLERHPSALLLIAGGEGAETPKLRSLVTGTGMLDNVKFLGARDDVPDLMVAADLFCVPSRWEGFASIMTEAMAVGARTLAASIPTLHEVGGSPPWCGFALSDDPEAWSEAISDILDGECSTDWASLRVLAQDRFKSQWTAQRISDDMEQFFQFAITNWKRGRE